MAVSNWRSGAALRHFIGHEREVTKVRALGSPSGVGEPGMMEHIIVIHTESWDQGIPGIQLGTIWLDDLKDFFQT